MMQQCNPPLWFIYQNAVLVFLIVLDKAEDTLIIFSANAFFCGVHMLCSWQSIMCCRGCRRKVSSSLVLKENLWSSWNAAEATRQTLMKQQYRIDAEYYYNDLHYWVPIGSSLLHKFPNPTTAWQCSTYCLSLIDVSAHVHTTSKMVQLKTQKLGPFIWSQRIVH